MVKQPNNSSSLSFTNALTQKPEQTSSSVIYSQIHAVHMNQEESTNFSSRSPVNTREKATPTSIIRSSKPEEAQ